MTLNFPHRPLREGLFSPPTVENESVSAPLRTMTVLCQDSENSSSLRLGCSLSGPQSCRGRVLSCTAPCGWDSWGWPEGPAVHPSARTSPTPRQERRWGP